MGTGEMLGVNPAMDWHPIQGGVEILLVASCHGNRDKLRPDGPLGSYADFTFYQNPLGFACLMLIGAIVIFIPLRIQTLNKKRKTN